MEKKEIAEKAVEILEKRYPDAVCSLKYEKPYELLIAVRLSAQCTDAKVNQVTPALFARYKSMEDFANADYDEVCDYVHQCGFYHAKARSIIDMCAMMLEKYNGEVPDSIEELVKLPGVGRKTANLIMGDIYKQPAIVVDTHFMRITRRLGLHADKDPKKIEKELRPLIPPEKSSDFCHRLVLFGREICSSQKPKCEICPLSDICISKK